MSKRILFWLGLLILGTNVCNATSTSITISGQSKWESTGVNITPEAVVTIEASGQWCGAPWSCYGPDGTTGIAPSAFLAPGLPSGGLVGKVGNNSPFFVGSMCSFNGQDHGTGALYLAFNDDRTGYYNNSGTLDVTITTTEEGGNILVYATSETTYGYYASSFDEQLPAILAEEGFSTTVTDRIEIPEITAALLDGYNQLWIMSSDPYSGSGCFSNNEISAILDFRNAGKAILIMADDGPPGHSYIGDANQISTQLGVTFYGQYDYGPTAEPFEPDFSQHPLFSGVQNIVCTGGSAILEVNSPSEVVATYQGNNMIAVLDDGVGRVVFDVSFTRFWDADERVGFVPHITVGNTPQYVKNIAGWLSEGGQQPEFQVTVTAKPDRIITMSESSLEVLVTLGSLPVNGADVSFECQSGSFEPNSDMVYNTNTNFFGFCSVIWQSDQKPLISSEPEIQSVITIGVTYGQLTYSTDLVISVIPINNAGIPQIRYTSLLEYFEDWSGVSVDVLWEQGKWDCIEQDPCNLSYGNIQGQELSQDYYWYYSGWLDFLDEYKKFLNCYECNHSGLNFHDWEYYSECFSYHNPEIFAVGALLSKREPSQHFGNAFYWEFTGDENTVKMIGISIEFLAAYYGATEPLKKDLLESAVKALIRQQWGYGRLSFAEYHYWTGLVDIGSGIWSFDPSKPYYSLESLRDHLKIVKGSVKLVSNDQDAISIISHGKEIASILVNLSEIPATSAKAFTDNASDQNNIEGKERLHQNHPNPFNPITTISFNLPEASDVMLDVFNIAGQKVATLVDSYLEAGGHRITWDSRDSHSQPVASGIYLYRIKAGNHADTKKMLLLK